MADSSPNTGRGFTAKPNCLVFMKLHNYGEEGKIKKKVWKQKPIQTKSTISLTAITSYWSEWKQYHTWTKGSNNVTSLGCKVAGREAKLAVLVWERLPGVPEGGPGHRGPPAHYAANDGEVAVVACEITHVCDQPILQVFLLKTRTLWVTQLLRQCGPQTRSSVLKHGCCRAPTMPRTSQLTYSHNSPVEKEILTASACRRIREAIKQPIGAEF